MHTIEIQSLSELKAAAQKFVSLTKDQKKFAFYGLMGSGKTTFIKAICEELGAKGLVTSPTFSLVNEYPLESGAVIYHFDLYRINNIGELYDLGYEEYFYSDNYIFIEWAEKAESLLPEPVIKVVMKEVNAETRHVTIEN